MSIHDTFDKVQNILDGLGEVLMDLEAEIGAALVAETEKAVEDADDDLKEPFGKSDIEHLAYIMYQEFHCGGAAWGEMYEDRDDFVKELFRRAAKLAAEHIDER